MQAAEGAAAWKPRLFNKKQARAVERLCEAIIPRTDTPGARDALAHQFIDLELSLAEDGGSAFLEGLGWLQSHCKRQLGRGMAKISDEELVSLLEPLSDTRSSSSSLVDCRSADPALERKRART